MLLFGPAPFFLYLPSIFCSSLLIRLLQLLLEHTPHLHLIWKTVLTQGRLLPGLMNTFCCCMQMACFCLSPPFLIPFLDSLDLDKGYSLWKCAAWDQEISWREEISLWDFRVKIISYIFWYPPITIFPSSFPVPNSHTYWDNQLSSSWPVFVKVGQFYQPFITLQAAQREKGWNSWEEKNQLGCASYCAL